MVRKAGRVPYSTDIKHVDLIEVLSGLRPLMPDKASGGTEENVRLWGLNALALHPMSSQRHNCKAEWWFLNEYFGGTLLGSSRTRGFTS
jgi:hypothetical protein